jgi:hypothetical protein
MMRVIIWRTPGRVELDRRRFLKYAGATAAIVGASALGLDYFRSRPLLPNATHTTSAGTPSPPTIKNAMWTPSRTLNDKVYDGIVSFEADSSATPIMAEIQFSPIAPPGIPSAAIPQESNRSYSLQSDLRNAEFSQPIVNLAGGKKYSALVTV